LAQSLQSPLVSGTGHIGVCLAVDTPVQDDVQPSLFFGSVKRKTESEKNLKSPRLLLNAFNLRVNKRLGQNFLSDPAMAAKIIAQSNLNSDDTVLEIGAGLGGLTLPLSAKVRQILAVETDRHLIQVLKKVLGQSGVNNVRLIHADILHVDFTRLMSEIENSCVVVGNLPYHVSSQILIRLIHQRQFIRKAVLMFQKELALRLMCGPGSKQYGRITVMLNYCATVKKIVTVPPQCFYPRPKIDSQVLAITFIPERRTPKAHEHQLFKVVKAAFSKRRKTLQNALSQSNLGIDATTVQTALIRAGIDPIRRAETVTVEEFTGLTEALRRQKVFGAK
jgi:16S rRNA (adenine1518-N6/adenine1519-N6)-dimethyltransferase